MSFYEHVVIARQDISAQQAEALAADLAKIVENNGGKVLKTENWGLRNIAYKIQKNRKGHYFMLEIEGNGAVIAELERNVRLSEDVIRYMTVRIDAPEEGPSVVLQSKSERGERGDRGERSGFRGDRADRPRRDRWENEGEESGNE